mmetsp:Transcript_59215/g.176128  ORF Transcript_59215/g.176128 Transcript_59215/m.176128 type:complete len:297 (-) Transcript_59215:1049-1939(-)
MLHTVDCQTGAGRGLLEAKDLNPLHLRRDSPSSQECAAFGRGPQRPGTKLEVHIKKTPAVLVCRRLVVVNVHTALCRGSRWVQIDVESEGVLPHARGAPSDARLERHHSAGAVVSRDAVKGQLQLVLARRGEGSGVQVIPPSALWQNDRGRVATLRHGLAHAADQDHVAQHEVMLHRVLVCVRCRVVQEVPEERPDNWVALGMVLLEDGVPQGQHLVPQLQRGLHAKHGCLVVGVRLAARGLQVRVVPQEGVGEHGKLVPPRYHLRVGVLEEAADVRANERLAAEGQGANHGHRGY